MAEDILPLFLDCSTDWQRLLHIVPGGLGLSYKDALGSQYPKFMEKETNPPTMQELHLEKIADLMVDKIKPFIEQVVESAIANHSELITNMSYLADTCIH